MLIAQGADVVEGQTALGPSKASTTAGVYLHEFDRAGRGVERMPRLERIFGVARRTSRPGATWSICDAGDDRSARPKLGEPCERRASGHSQR
jgi:hypothetical protein